MGKDNYKIVAQNKKAGFDYFIEERYEAGIELAGTEVKSVRMGKASIKESYVQIDKNGEVIIIGMHISPYEKGNIFNKDPMRTRKLLLHRFEINKLLGKVKTAGYTLVPTKVYLKGSLVKIEIGLARGKKNYDKRQDMVVFRCILMVQRSRRSGFSKLDGTTVLGYALKLFDLRITQLIFIFFTGGYLNEHRCC